MCYMAPEVLMRQVPSFSADVYAFGVTACEAATGVMPYSDRARWGQAHIGRHVIGPRHAF
jgi:serine/threonine protein kinase